MKKIITAISLVLFAVIMQSPNSAKASAVSVDTSQTKVIYDSNQKGYFVETIENAFPESNPLIKPNSVTYSASNTSVITKTKTVRYYDANDVLCLH